MSLSARPQPVTMTGSSSIVLLQPATCEPARHGAGGPDLVALREAPARLARRGPAHACVCERR